ncbi:hypothetical protein [Sphingomonas sp. VNH70]|uniref:hypothetical protein n=1 Tax=Sphingomonas silueang TaxID=3156617 RepID=UPI0032B58CA5
MDRAYGIAAVLLPVMLAGCASPGTAAIEAAVERGWQQDVLGMEVACGLATAEEVRGLRTVRNTRTAAIDAVEAWGGGTARALAERAVGIAAAAGSDLAGPGAQGRQVELLAARAWDVTNLEVLERRQSGDGVVVRVRYDVSAEVGGTRESVARDVTQLVRLERRDGDWTVAL